VRANSNARRRAGMTIARPAARLQRFIDAGVFGFLATRPDGSVAEANDYYLALVGFTRDELAGGADIDISSLTPPEWLHADELAMTEIGERGTCASYEKELIRHDGTRIPVFVAKALLNGSDEIGTFVLDISDRKDAEAALIATAAAMRSSLDAMIDPFLICSAVRDSQAEISSFRVDFANLAAGEFLGLDAETLVGAVIPDEMMSLRARPFSELVRGVVERGREWCEDAVEFTLPDREGSVIAGKVNIQIAKFGDGFFAAWRDVTERESAISALRASEMRARELVDNSADGILISGPDGRYLEANPAMCRMLGYPRAELLTMRAGDLTADDDPIGNAAMHKRLADPPEAAGFLTERRYRRRDGTSLPVEVRFSMLSGGRQQRNVRDITDRLAAEAMVASEARIQVALFQTLQRIAADASIEETGQAICDVLGTLPGIDYTGLYGFFGEDEVVMLAGNVPDSFPTHCDESLPPEQARGIQARAALGSWSGDQTEIIKFGSWGKAAVDSGLQAAAVGPIVVGKLTVGVLIIGTSDESFARTLVSRMPALSPFTAAASGLLADRIHGRRRSVEMRRRIGHILKFQSFHPVFQPIVDLAAKNFVGFEALTRFDSGQQPDLCLADAWTVGLGPDMELATMEAAIAAAKKLPSGRWLALNLSPRLLNDPDRLRAVLWGAERPLVIEVTEHEIIEDYAAVREAIRTLGHDVRLAVDDAGAGIANFGHIVELRPDLVKLDISLVRRVNANLGRQALVVGMRHFSRTAGCRLIAEGIETEEEAATLRGFGVEFGQGYLFGRPEIVEVWAEGRGPA
jgi:PAS domain S-box-containing protein